MPFTYAQDTGALFDPNGVLLVRGYSGNTTGLNNPMAQNRVGVGPLPQGVYTIGPPHSPVDHLGPLALPLYPDHANAMFGRSGFFMHGDNSKMNHTASNGCIIMPPQVRKTVNEAYVKKLHVVATEVEARDLYVPAPIPLVVTA